jgi:hypothetical protein
MNKEQAHIISESMSEYTKNLNKINEFNQKFFNEKGGVLNENNMRINKDLSVGVYFGSAGRTIKIDNELLNDVIEFFKKLQDYYADRIKDISIDKLIEKLQSK